MGGRQVLEALSLLGGEDIGSGGGGVAEVGLGQRGGEHRLGRVEGSRSLVETSDGRGPGVDGGTGPGDEGGPSLQRVRVGKRAGGPQCGQRLLGGGQHHPGGGGIGGGGRRTLGQTRPAQGDRGLLVTQTVEGGGRLRALRGGGAADLVGGGQLVQGLGGDRAELLGELTDLGDPLGEAAARRLIGALGGLEGLDVGHLAVAVSHGRGGMLVAAADGTGVPVHQRGRQARGGSGDERFGDGLQASGGGLPRRLELGHRRLELDQTTASGQLLPGPLDGSGARHRLRRHWFELGSTRRLVGHRVGHRDDLTGQRRPSGVDTGQVGLGRRPLLVGAAKSVDARPVALDLVAGLGQGRRDGSRIGVGAELDGRGRDQRVDLVPGRDDGPPSGGPPSGGGVELVGRPGDGLGGQRRLQQGTPLGDQRRLAVELGAGLLELPAGVPPLGVGHGRGGGRRRILGRGGGDASRLLEILEIGSDLLQTSGDELHIVVDLGDHRRILGQAPHHGRDVLLGIATMPVGLAVDLLDLATQVGRPPLQLVDRLAEQAGAEQLLEEGPAIGGAGQEEPLELALR